MSASLIMHDIWSFGVLQTEERPDFGLAFSHALVHDYTNYRSRMGIATLFHDTDYIGYVSSIMESVEGFSQLSERSRTRLLYDGVEFLTRYIDETERLQGTDSPILQHYVISDHQRAVALIV